MSNLKRKIEQIEEKLEEIDQNKETIRANMMKQQNHVELMALQNELDKLDSCHPSSFSAVDNRKTFS